VKQAEQALTDAKSSMERKQSELQSRQDSLERAAENLATKRQGLTGCSFFSCLSFQIHLD